MSKSVEKMEKCKKHVSSLLVSAGATPGTFGKTLTLAQLQADYENFIGERLPVRELGFNTPEQLFREMSDTIQLLHKYGELHVQGVSSGKTAHIEKMISRQKTQPKVPKPKRPGPGGGRGGRGGRYGGIGRGGYTRPSIRRVPQPQTPLIQPVRTVPAMIRSTIHDLLLAFPQGVLLTNFNHAYSKRFNQQIAVEKLGFSSLYEFFESMRDMVSIEAVGDYNARVRMKAIAPVAIKHYKAPVTVPESSSITQSTVTHPSQISSQIDDGKPPQATRPLTVRPEGLDAPPRFKALQEERQPQISSQSQTIAGSQTATPSHFSQSHTPQKSSSSSQPTSQLKSQSWAPKQPTLESYITASSQISQPQTVPISSQPSISSSSVSLETTSKTHPSSMFHTKSESSSQLSSHKKSTSQTFPSSSQQPQTDRSFSGYKSDSRTPFSTLTDSESKSHTSSTQKSQVHSVTQRPQSQPHSQPSSQEISAKYSVRHHSSDRPHTPQDVLSQTLKEKSPILSSNVPSIGSPKPGYDQESPATVGNEIQMPNVSKSVKSKDDYRPFEGEDGMANLRKAVQLVLQKNPDGIRSIYFAEIFESIIAEELPVHTLGHHSVIELMGSMLDIVYIERFGQKDWLLFDTRYKSSSNDPPQSEKYSIKKPVPTATAPKLDSTFKERIRQVVQAYNGYIKMEDLPKCYFECMAEELPVRQLGFAAMEVLVRQLPDYVKIENLKTGVMLTPVGPVLDPNFSLLRYRPHQQGIDQKHASTVPPDAVGPGAIYKPLIAPTDVKMMEVYVGQIISPSKFWLQLKGIRTTSALEDLMDKLETFYYGDQSKSYRVPEFMLMIGQVCVAIFPNDENWHRVTITGFRQLDYVEVYFVDYGGHCTVHKDNLRLLRNQFFRLPAQALLARLAHIKPVGGDRWCEAAGRRMLAMCDNRPLYAIITDISSEIMSVALCDTSGAEDIHINDVLVNEGLAVISPDDGSIPDQLDSDVEEGTEDGSEETSSICSTELTLGDLRANLEILSFRRKRILQTLYAGVDTDETSVEQLKVIEQQIANTRRAMRELDLDENNLAVGASSSKSAPLGEDFTAPNKKEDLSESQVTSGGRPVATVTATMSPLRGKTTNTVAPMPISTTISTASSQASALPASMASLTLNPSSNLPSGAESSPVCNQQQQMQQVILQYQLLLNQASLQASQQAQQLMLMNAPTLANFNLNVTPSSGGGDATGLPRTGNLASTLPGLTPLPLGTGGLPLNPNALTLPTMMVPTAATTAQPSATVSTATSATPSLLNPLVLPSAGRGSGLMAGFAQNSITANLGRGSSQSNVTGPPHGLNKHPASTNKSSGGKHH